MTDTTKEIFRGKVERVTFESERIVIYFGEYVFYSDSFWRVRESHSIKYSAEFEPEKLSQLVGLEATHELAKFGDPKFEFSNGDTLEVFISGPDPWTLETPGKIRVF